MSLPHILLSTVKEKSPLDLHYVVDVLLRSPAGKSLAVDVGCGTGLSTLAFADHFDRVVGMDISENQINEARKSVDNDERRQKVVEFKYVRM